MRVYLAGIGITAAGLENWQAAQAILAGQQPYIAKPCLKAAQILSATERRRSSEAVRIAVTVAEQALLMAGCQGQAVRTVFTSADADSVNTNQICITLATQPNEVSPTRFHNCVHNAAAGYWTIASDCHAPSVSITANQMSFACGLLEASTQALVEQQPVLLVGFDVVMPFPLHAHQPTTQPLGIALLLTPEATAHSVAALDVSLLPHTTHALPALPLPAWAETWQPHPILSGLALLYACVQKHPNVYLAYQAQQTLQIDLQCLI